MNEDTGVQAFPRIKEIESHAHGEKYIYRDSMTLRDYFAGQALASLKWIGRYNDTVSNQCYEIADAMIKERDND